MFVKNRGNAMDITFQVIPPAAASPRAYPIFSESLAIDLSVDSYKYTLFSEILVDEPVQDFHRQAGPETVRGRM